MKPYCLLCPTRLVSTHSKPKGASLITKVTTSRACSAPYRHVNFLKIIAIKWKSSYTVGSVIDHFQRSSSQARLGLIIIENDLEPPTV